MSFFFTADSLAVRKHHIRNLSLKHSTFWHITLNSATQYKKKYTLLRSDLYEQDGWGNRIPAAPPIKADEIIIESYL